MITYYSEWLRELEWLICSLCCAAHMYNGCPHANNHIAWKRNADSVIEDVKSAMLKKEQDSDLKIFKMRMKLIKKTISELNTLELPWFLIEEHDFFNENFKEFISTCRSV